MRRWGPPLALLALAACLLFLDLGTLGLTDRDEGSNAEAAREMVETGNWLYPTLNGVPRFAKPIFIYWLTGGAYVLFGVSEFTARLPSAVFAVGLILLQYGFLTRLCGALVGLFGALMLLLNIEMIAIGRMALTDSVLIFFTTLSLYGLWLGIHGEGRARHFVWLFYLGMALGTLTKGPVGVLVPLLGAVPYLFIAGRWRQFWQNGYPLAGLALFVLLTVPWYAMMLVIHGTRYIDSAQADTVGRFFNIIGGHGGTLFFYVPVLLFGFFPWSGFLPAAIWQAVKSWRTGLRERELEWFAACWLIAVFVFFSLSATRLPHYIGPLFPAAALLTAIYWNRSLAEPRTPGLRLSFRLLMLLGYLLGFTLISASFLYSTFLDKITREFPAAAQADPGAGPMVAGLLLIIGVGVVAYFGLSEDRRAGAFWAAGATLFLVILIALEVTLPRFSRYFIDPPHELAYIAGLNLQPEEQLIVYGPPKPSVLFYARRRAIMVKPGEEEQMKPHLAGPHRTMILLPSRLKSRLPPEASGFSTILDRFGYSLLSSEPMLRLPEQPKPAIPPNPHGF
ncbi:ArnT family glycosyltransferase [Candidatus Nitrospira bockiana]